MSIPLPPLPVPLPLGLNGNKVFVGPPQLIGAQNLLYSKTVYTSSTGQWSDGEGIYLLLQPNDNAVTIQTRIKAQILLNSGDPTLNVVFI